MMIVKASCIETYWVGCSRTEGMTISWRLRMVGFTRRYAVTTLAYPVIGLSHDLVKTICKDRGGLPCLSIMLFPQAGA
jgi:hypothetical protein